MILIYKFFQKLYNTVIRKNNSSAEMGYNSVTEEEKRICAELWCEHESFMRNYCRAKLRGSNIEIDDTVGDLYLALCNQIDKNGFPKDTKAWLYKTAKNIINEKYRKKYKRDKHIVDIDAEVIKLQYAHNFVETIEVNEQIEKVGNLIANMNGDNQTILHKTYFDKRPMKEIAEKLGSTESAVKQKRYRICRQLEKNIK